jgi:ethanolamine utilization protein EutQ (cupin superfamily)
MEVRKIDADAANGDWAQVSGEIYVADVVDHARAPGAEMTVGFARLERGEAMDISFPYDEVLVITRGAYTIRTEEGEELTARAGEAIYLPAGASSGSVAEEDTEMVYIAAPPAVYAEHVAAASA